MCIRDRGGQAGVVQERAVFVPPDPSQGLVQLDVQIDDRVTTQPLPSLGSPTGAAAEGQHAGRSVEQLGDGGRFDVAEARLPLRGEDVLDRAPLLVLDDQVTVDERQPEAFSDEAADRGLAPVSYTHLDVDKRQV